MDREINVMSQSYCDWIIKEIIDDCTHTGLSLEDNDVRRSIITGLRDAAKYIERLANPNV